MKYKKIISRLMFSAMTLNILQQGVTVYAEEQVQQAPATTVSGEDAKKSSNSPVILFLIR